MSDPRDDDLDDDLGGVPADADMEDDDLGADDLGADEDLADEDDEGLDDALEDTFPASDPLPPPTRPGT